MDVKLLRKKRDLTRRDIVKLINKFNSLKLEREKINEEVKENKNSREEAVNRIREIIKEIKELNQVKNSINAEDVNSLKKLINRKEWFFQINVLSIKKEESLMKEIKDLRQRLKNAKQSSIVMSKIRRLMRELESTRRKHNKLHNLVIEKAEESGKVSIEMKKVQKMIKTLKKEGKKVNFELREAEQEMRRIEALAKKRASSIKKRENMLIKQRQEEVLEKLKKKKKLTTDDLVVFQKK